MFWVAGCDVLPDLLPELSADVAGPDPQLCQLHYPHSDVVGEGATIHKYSTKLVHFAIRIHMGL